MGDVRDAEPPASDPQNPLTELSAVTRLPPSNATHWAHLPSCQDTVSSAAAAPATGRPCRARGRLPPLSCRFVAPLAPRPRVVPGPRHQGTGTRHVASHPHETLTSGLRARVLQIPVTGSNPSGIMCAVSHVTSCSSADVSC